MPAEGDVQTQAATLPAAGRVCLPSRAVIFANGELPRPERVRALVRPGDWIIAADGGAKHCRRLGLVPAVLIGDMDSLPSSELHRQTRAGVATVRFPEAKDYTDLELALAYAVEHGATEILVCGVLGGRWDHTLANLALGLSPAFDQADIRFDDGETEILFLRNGTRHTLHGDAGDLVSLIPLGGDAIDVETTGLLYPLAKETLKFGSTRGVSNVLVAREASVGLGAGSLVCLRTRSQPTDTPAGGTQRKRKAARQPRSRPGGKT